MCDIKHSFDSRQRSGILKKYNTLRKIAIARITQKITRKQKFKLKFYFILLSNLTLVSLHWFAKPKHKKQWFLISFCSNFVGG